LLAVLTVLTCEPQWLGLDPATTWLAVWPDLHSFEVLTTIYLVSSAATAVAVAVTFAVRVRRLKDLDRRVMSPVLTTMCVAAAVNAADNLLPLFGPSESLQDSFHLIQESSLVVVPLAYLVAAVRRRLSRESLPDLVTALAGATDPQAVQTVLRDYLADPTLTIRYRSDETGEYVDAAGGRSAPEEAAERRRHSTTVRDHRDEPLAIIGGDPSLRRHPQLLRSVSRAVALVLDNDVLSVRIGLQIAEAARSTARITHAIEVERRRLADEVAIGPQRRLRSVLQRLDMLDAPPGSAFDAALRGLREQAEDAADALLDVVTGQHVGHISGIGLGPALTQAAHDLSGTIQVDVLVTGQPIPMAADAYLISSELMVNAVKHAQADVITVSVVQHPDCLVVEVVDDGRGGADPSGHGLSGVRQRLRRLDGELKLDSPTGGGTRVRVRLPA